jgi:hypothetical protein
MFFSFHAGVLNETSPGSGHPTRRPSRPAGRGTVALSAFVSITVARQQGNRTPFRSLIPPGTIVRPLRTSLQCNLDAFVKSRHSRLPAPSDYECIARVQGVGNRSAIQRTEKKRFRTSRNDVKRKIFDFLRDLQSRKTVLPDHKKNPRSSTEDRGLKKCLNPHMILAPKIVRTYSIKQVFWLSPLYRPSQSRFA